LKIAFYSHHLSERGTEVALFDYARYNEEILGNESIIVYNPNTPYSHRSSIDKFKSRFQVETVDIPGNCFDGYTIIPEIDKILKGNQCDVLYAQNSGKNDGMHSNFCKTVILACSTIYQPHGDRYAYVSRWLSDVMTGGNAPWLPIIIDLYDTDKNFRSDLKIPDDAFVFGRTGGMDTWNISWVNQVISTALDVRKDLYFVFQNTPRFITHERVKFIETTADVIFKSTFINTCDAMIHARNEGESFGQTIAEFSTRNKPIVTFYNSSEKAHIDILRDKGIYYSNSYDLFSILTKIQKQTNLDWNCYKNHTPKNGIEAFKRAFLD
jgi:hypothetical protein